MGSKNSSVAGNVTSALEHAPGHLSLWSGRRTADQPELVDSKRDQDQGERLKLCRPCHMLRDPWNQIEQGKHLSEASTQGPGDLPGPSHEDISGRDGRDGCKNRIVSSHVDVQNERPREDRGPE